MKNDFSQAVSKFAKKITKTLPELIVTKQSSREDAAKRFSRVTSKGLRRTTSFTGIQIEEASDEELEENLSTKDNGANLDVPRRGLRKNSSQLSLLSMSHVSNSSKGFWPKSRPSLIDSSYIQRSRSRHFMSDKTIFKQRRVKLNLENNIKWNGPHDEPFFRILEQYLDETIAKFVVEPPEEAKSIHQSRFGLQKRDSRGTRSSS